MNVLISGATGMTGTWLLGRLADSRPGLPLHCLIRPTSDCRAIDRLNLSLRYHTGDSSREDSWISILRKQSVDTIVHIASIRHLGALLFALNTLKQNPRLIVVGTTGVYSRYNRYSAGYKLLEEELGRYEGPCCLLRPTMIYGSHRDKNLHRLILFCDRFGFFPVFGAGDNAIQPVHGEDLAEAIRAVLQDPSIEGSYDLSGGSVVSFKELVAIVGKSLQKSVRPVFVPLSAGLALAKILEGALGGKSPVRVEQVLRLQEDKAYSHEKAAKDFGFAPRSLEAGLRQEVELMRRENSI